MWQKCTGQVRNTDHWQVLAAFEGVSQVRISQGCLASAHPKNPCCPVDILAQEPGWVDAFPQQSGWEAVVLANVVSCYLWNLLAAISLLTSLCCCFSLPMPLVPCPCAAAKPKKICLEAPMSVSQPCLQMYCVATLCGSSFALWGRTVLWTKLSRTTSGSILVKAYAGLLHVLLCQSCFLNPLYAFILGHCGFFQLQIIRFGRKWETVQGRRREHLLTHLQSHHLLSLDRWFQ